MARKIVITSGKGGVGKTTFTANFGLALASMKYRVLLVDLDFGLNNLDVVTGVENKIVYDISDYLDGRCRLKQAIVQDDKEKSLFILPSGGVSAFSGITGQNVKLMLENLSPLFDYILIDCPAGIETGFHRAVSSADAAIVIVTPNLTSIRDADKAVGVLRSYKLDSVDLVVNRARGDLIMDNKMINPLDIKDILNVNLLGVLPEEDSVFISVGYGSPLDGETVKAYKMIAEKYVKGKGRVFDATKKYSGFFGSIRRSIKRGV